MAGVLLPLPLWRLCFWDVFRKQLRAAIFAIEGRRPHGLQFCGDIRCQPLISHYVRCGLIRGKATGTDCP